MQLPKRNLLWTLGAGALAVAVGLTGCSNNNATAPSQVLTQAQADTVAEAVAADVAVLPEGMTYSSTASVPVQSPPMGGAMFVPQSTGAGCTPTKSPASPVNSDADPVPDSVRYDFTGCVITVGNFTLTLGGTIDFIDPTPTVTDFAVKTVFTNFTRTLTDPTSKSRSVKENGSRTVSGSASTLQRTESGFHTDYTFADGSTAAHVRTWSATFTADVAGSIRRDSLPNGTWNLTGTSTWTRGTNSYSIAVTTSPQLHYNATCTVTPRFDMGTLAAVVTRNNVTTNVTIQFTACGQYLVTRS